MFTFEIYTWTILGTLDNTFKATIGGQNANFHTTSLPPLVALTIIVET